MRNLKKILALVLALVMSLSLMATAGASQFPDVEESNPYATAIDVLDELKVFQGFEDGTFKPTDNLNRAQAAVLVYRIATGDVEGKYVDNYTDMAQSKFIDLDGYTWAKGYINYCQNAKIVVGTDATHFNPGGQVTGYQLMVMLLRTLGYGAAGEFTDPNGWELETAKIAEREGILKNITGGNYGAAAPRQMVAEILFQGLLQETVQYSALVPGGYTKSGETLGYKNLKLRDVTGVVTANKWANLYGDSVLADEQTNVILTGEEKSTRIGIDTELNDIGEVRHFYLTGDVGAKEANFIAYDQEGVTNNTYSNAGAAAKVSDSKIDVTKDTEQFLNFGYDTEGKSEYRLEYRVSFDNSATYTYDGKTSQEWFEDRYGVDPADVLDNDNRFDTITTAGTVTTYTRVIPRNDGISADDIAIMEGIFSVADDDTTKSAGIDGYVFAGTNSSADVKRNLDLSDEMEWNEFYNTYIASRANTKISSVENGEWLKVVDNNNDGIAEYVFKTEFWLDEAVGTHTFKGETITEYYQLSEDDKNYDVRYIDEVDVGDVVIYTKIDGKANVCLADMIPDEVNKINYRTTEIDTVSNGTKGQSGITNDTEMEDNILNMSDKTEYNIYLDEFGYVRAYKLPGGTEYALVTELYYGNANNSAFQQGNSITVELGIKEEQVQEFGLDNARNNAFIAPEYYGYSIGKNNNQYNDYLQPASSHVGTPSALDNDGDNFVPTATGNYSPWRDNTDKNYYFWDNQIVRDIRNTDAGGNAITMPSVLFNYPQTFSGRTLDNSVIGTRNNVVSLTNIGVISGLGEDSVTLNGAAKYAYDKTTGDQLYRVYDDVNRGYVNGRFSKNEKVTEAEWIEAYNDEYSTVAGQTAFNTALATGDLLEVFAVDYIQLDHTQSIAKGARHYDIGGTLAYQTINNEYVNAIHATEYYIVDGSGHVYFTDYANVPAIDASKIHSVYAVAKNTTADQDEAPYWVADVIVIEVNDWSEENFHSISLAYFESQKESGRVHSVESLNNESEDPMLTLIRDVDWNNWGYDGQGFYKLINAEDAEDGLEVGKMRLIDATHEGGYNANGIYAATVERMESIEKGGDYIDVRLTTGAYAGDVVAIRKAPAYVVGTRGADEVTLSSGSNSDVKKGDAIIFVLNNDQDSTSFIVDLSLNAADWGLLSVHSKTPTWLKVAYEEISEEQGWTGGDKDDVALVIKAAQRLLAAGSTPSAYQLEKSAEQLAAFVAPGSGYVLTPAQIALIGDTSGADDNQLYDQLTDKKAEVDAADDAALAQKVSDAAEKLVADAKVGDFDLVAAKLQAVKDATVANVWDSALDRLKPTATEVEDLQDAIDLAKTALPAVAALEALVGDKDLSLYEGAQEAYDAVEAAIYGIDDDAALAAVWADGELTGDAVAALKVALDKGPMTPEEKEEAEAAKAAANEKIAAAVEAIGDASLTFDPITTANATTKPTETEVKAAIKGAVDTALADASVEGITVTVTLDDTYDADTSFADLDAGDTGATIAYSLSVVDTAGKGDADTSITGESATINWYLNETGAKKVLSDAITAGTDVSVEASSLTGGSEADGFKASVKSQLEALLPGATVTVETSNTTWTATTAVSFTYTLSYPGMENDASGLTGSITLG